MAGIIHDSKQTNLHNTSRHQKYLIAGTIAVVGLVIYVWSKVCQVLRETLHTSQDGWWIMKTFNSKDSAGISFTEKQFYLALLGAVRGDIVGVVTFIYDKGLYFPDVQIMFMILVTILSVCVGAYTFYKTYYNSEAIRKEEAKGQTEAETIIQKEKFKGQTKAAPNEMGPKKAKKDIPTEKNEETMNIWKTFGLENKHKRYRRLVAGMMFFAFLFSIPWEFVRLYQTMVAEKVTQMTTGIPAECVPDQMSMTQSLKSWLHSKFSWSADPCLQYHKALLVDPMWQVPPLMVITSALSHCLIYPIEVFFSTFGKALRLFFNEIPVQYQPIMLVIFVIILMLVLIMTFGYRIRCPLISIEPKKSLRILHHPDQRRGNQPVFESLDSSIDSSLDCSITPSIEAELYNARKPGKK